MVDIDRAVLQNLLMAVPYKTWSPLFHDRNGRHHFLEWCSSDLAAAELIRETLAEAPVFELNNGTNEFVLSVEYAEAEHLVRGLVTAYEDQKLAALFAGT